jgi:hypothetical protein
MAIMIFSSVSNSSHHPLCTLVCVHFYLFSYKQVCFLGIGIPLIIMVGAFVGIWIEISWLKNQMSASFHAGASSMVSSVTKTAAIVCGSYLALFFPAFLLITFHPQPPCANLPGKQAY